MRRHLLAALALASSLATPSLAQDIAITNARLVIGDGSAPISGATVVVRGGKVVAAGSAVAIPAGVETVDAGGQFVTPGLVAGYSRLGLVDVDAVGGSNDADAGGSIYSAGIDISPALNPFGTPVAVNRTGGVTRALVFPGDSAGLFRGQGAVVDLGSDSNMLTRARVFQYAEFGESGAATAGGSRAATFLTFRAMLAEARDYARNPAGYGGGSKDALLQRADAEALARVLDGRDRLFLRADRAADILGVLGLTREFPAIKLTLVGAGEGWKVASELAAARVPVITSSLNDLPANFEQLAATQSNTGRMAAAGVDVSVALFDDDVTHKLFYLTQYAGNMVALTRVPGATGLSWDAAFAAITSAPARAAGMDGQIGSLRPGRVGDVVIWDADPLELGSRPTAVWIDGVRQPLGNRQDRLRDRYLTPGEGALPKAYDR